MSSVGCCRHFCLGRWKDDSYSDREDGSVELGVYNQAGGSLGQIGDTVTAGQTSITHPQVSTISHPQQGVSNQAGGSLGQIGGTMTAGQTSITHPQVLTVSYHAPTDRVSIGHDVSGKLGQTVEPQASLGRYTVDDRLTITIIAGDLTEVPADIIVNTTDADLNLSKGALSAAILRAAGPSIQREAWKNKSRIEPGQFVQTSGGGLKFAAHIFHGYVNNWDGEKGTSLQSMRTLVAGCLDVAHALRCGSIAFPAIGAGGRHIPTEICVRVMREEINKFAERHKQTLLSRILIALHPDDTYAIAAFASSLNDEHSTASHASTSDNSVSSGNADDSTERPGGSLGQIGHTVDWDQMSITSSEVSSASYVSDDLVTSGSDISSDLSEIVEHHPSLGHYTVKDRLTITIVTEDITKIPGVSIIVNTTDADLDLSKGALSAAILRAAGPSIQDECRQNGSTIDPGQFVRTSAGRLKFADYLFHGYVSNWDGDQGTSEQSLRTLLEDCLDGAHDLGCSTIAFPAIGAGGRDIPAAKCAQVIREEIDKFAERHTQTSLSRILIALRPVDAEVIAAFTECLKDVLSPAHNASSNDISDLPRNNWIPLPDHWSSDCKSAPRLHKVNLDPEDTVYKEIKDTLVKSKVDNTIKMITRIENVTLYQEYASRRSKIQKDWPDKVVERTLYHGTKAESTNHINHHGFNRSFAGDANAARLGNGCYFAVDPAYSAKKRFSHAKHSIKYIYRCLVLTGVYCKGSKGLDQPPKIEGQLGGIRYDSVADNMENPTIFVTFRDSQVYPEYLIQLNDKDS